MSEWWTYRLSSFLLFSPRTYLRLQELYNVHVWPAQLAGLAIGAVLVVVLLRRSSHAPRIAAIALCICWGFVAWAYHAVHYATINWAAVYFAAAFAVQALLLLWIGIGSGTPTSQSVSGASRYIGAALLLWGLAGQPVLTALVRQGVARADYFATGPDSTVAATLGVLLLATWRRWLLWPIPLLWCALSGAFVAMMRLPDAPVAPLAALIALVTAVYDARLRRRIA